jgi:hypothetical protein
LADRFAPKTPLIGSIIRSILTKYTWWCTL